MRSLAFLPPRDFAVLKDNFPLNIIHKELKKIHHVLNSTSSLAAWSQFITNMFPSVQSPKQMRKKM